MCLKYGNNVCTSTKTRRYRTMDDALLLKREHWAFHNFFFSFFFHSFSIAVRTRQHTVKVLLYRPPQNGQHDSGVEMHSYLSTHTPYYHMPTLWRHRHVSKWFAQHLSMILHSHKIRSSRCRVFGEHRNIFAQCNFRYRLKRVAANRVFHTKWLKVDFNARIAAACTRFDSFIFFSPHSTFVRCLRRNVEFHFVWNMPRKIWWKMMKNTWYTGVWWEMWICA